MRASARVAWRVSAVVAFAATAILAITLTRGAPLRTALTSARNTRHSGAAAHRHARGPKCRMSGLRTCVNTGNDVMPRASDAAVEFTQVGIAAIRDTSVRVHQIVLTPGATGLRAQSR
jgi:hypothetical protein